MAVVGGPIRNKNGARYSRICFTLNNWTFLEYVAITEYNWKWMVVGKELSASNTPHLQGAGIFLKQMALSSIKKIPGLLRAHIEPMMGTCTDSLIYCSKQDGAAFSKGTMPEPGKRNDLEACIESIREGATMKDLAEKHGVEVVKYHKGLIALRSLLAHTRAEPPKVIWIFGPTGVGKTRGCIDFTEQYMGGDFWTSNGALQWFDGYDGQRVAIIDDLRGKHCSFSFLLRLLDRYTLRVPFKGGFVEWNPEIIFITCPSPPDTLFEMRGKHLPEDLGQLNRRLTQVINLATDKLTPAFVVKAIHDVVFPPANTTIVNEVEEDRPTITTTIVPPNVLRDITNTVDLTIPDSDEEALLDSDGESLTEWLEGRRRRP